MNKAIKVRIYPTLKQVRVLNNHFNAYRFSYNLCLEYRTFMWDNYKISKSGYDMQKELFKIRNETGWLSSCKAECVREAALGVEKSMAYFFKGNRYPKFKSKNGKQVFYANQAIRIIGRKIKFFGLNIRFRTSKSASSELSKFEIKRVTFSRDSLNRYYASCAIDTTHDIKNKLDGVVGIDLGIKDLISTSDGKKYDNKKELINALYCISRLHRKLSKSKKGSKNRAKISLKISKKYLKATNKKRHYYHQVSNDIIRDNQIIILEDLNISGLLKNRKLSKSISSVSWGTLLNILNYKAGWNDVKLIKINRFFPSSKKCSLCGNVKNGLLLSERTYICECCGLSIDRDINAAINIRNEGLKIPGLSVEDTVNRQANETESKRIIINN